jgi:hypothetical protein
MSSTEPRQLIYSYYIENSNIKNVFEALIKSYLSSNEILKLRVTDPGIPELIERIRETADFVYPTRISSIGSDLELQRKEKYKQLYGYVLNGKQSEVAHITNFNDRFDETFDSIMRNIMTGVLQVSGTVTEKTADPGALAELLDAVQSQLVDFSYNDTDYVTKFWNFSFERLLELLDDNLLMRELAIQTVARDVKLKDLGIRVGVPVPESSKFLFLLAERMEFFLNLIVDPTILFSDARWTSEKAEELYKEEKFFREISSSLCQVLPDHRDYLREALLVRPRA